MLRNVLILAIIWCSAIAWANTEKVIFLGPDSVEIPHLRPNFYDLNLDVLSPSDASVRKHLAVAFPQQEQKRGVQTWLLLDDLEPGRRYEVRVCWAATQPTEFWLHTWTIREVFDTPTLISALAEYSETLQSDSDLANPGSRRSTSGHSQGGSLKISRLFLQVYAAADFYTTNRTLMSNPPSVHVDLIFDPFVLNVIPSSLLPTVLYIILVSLGSWFVSGAVWRWLDSLRLDDKLHQT